MVGWKGQLQLAGLDYTRRGKSLIVIFRSNFELLIIIETGSTTRFVQVNGFQVLQRNNSNPDYEKKDADH